jgi:hypothetical protein
MIKANSLRLTKETKNILYTDFDYSSALWLKMRHSDQFSMVCSVLTTASSYDLQLDLPSDEIAGGGFIIF